MDKTLNKKFITNSNLLLTRPVHVTIISIGFGNDLLPCANICLKPLKCMHLLISLNNKEMNINSAIATNKTPNMICIGR
jgi:hypothetical protein